MANHDNMLVSDLLRDMQSEVHTIDPDVELREAIDELFDNKVNALLVAGTDGKLVGLISESDIVRAMGKFGRAAADFPVSEAMSIDLVVCEPKATIKEALKMMSDNKIRHLPIVNKSGHLSGVISVVELVHAMMKD